MVNDGENPYHYNANLMLVTCDSQESCTPRRKTL